MSSSADLARKMLERGGRYRSGQRPIPTGTRKAGNFNNSRVKTIQNKLNAKGYKLIADGDFGKKTRSAVRSFQRLHGLKDDGVVGAKTYAKLLGQ